MSSGIKGLEPRQEVITRMLITTTKCSRHREEDMNKEGSKRGNKPKGDQVGNHNFKKEISVGHVHGRHSTGSFAGVVEIMAKLLKSPFGVQDVSVAKIKQNIMTQGHAKRTNNNKGDTEPEISRVEAQSKMFGEQHCGQEHKDLVLEGYGKANPIACFGVHVELVFLEELECIKELEDATNEVKHKNMGKPHVDR